MASNQTPTDAPPPYITLPITQPLRVQNMAATDAPPPYTTLPITQPLRLQNNPGPLPPPQGPQRGHVMVQQPVRTQGPAPPPQGPKFGHVMVHQPVRGTRTQVPREILLNANEVGRVAGHDVICSNRSIMMHPNGANVEYRRGPVPITCQYCNARVFTKVEHKDVEAYICWMILLVVFCFPIGICILLCRILTMERYVHICPNCEEEVGAQPVCIQG